MNNLKSFIVIVLFFLLPNSVSVMGSNALQLSFDRIRTEVKSGCIETYIDGDVVIKIERCKGLFGSAYYQGNWLGNLIFKEYRKSMYRSDIESDRVKVIIRITKLKGEVDIDHWVLSPKDTCEVNQVLDLKIKACFNSNRLEIDNDIPKAYLKPSGRQINTHLRRSQILAFSFSKKNTL